MAKNFRVSISGTTSLLFLFCWLSSLASIFHAYKPGDYVTMSQMDQYNTSITEWHDMIRYQCPIFPYNSEVLIDLARPTDYSATLPFTISFLVGREKFLIPGLLIINPKATSEVPMIVVSLRYSENDLVGVTAKVVDLPHRYFAVQPAIRSNFWNPEHWPKHVLVKYSWEEQSEIEVEPGDQGERERGYSREDYRQRIKEVNEQ